MSRPRLYVHIGLQKTGTSYLQSVFWGSQEALRDQGLAMVPPSLDETFWLMLDVRGRYDAAHDPPAAGRAVEQLPAQLAAATGTRALLTEESLAPATDEQIQRLLAACGSHEVHVVVTARDLARQIPSSWQQRLQTGQSETFDDYLTRLQRTHERRADGPRGAWRQKDVVAVLERWAAHVPPERIHVVTVPPSGSDPSLLLDRFCALLEVDPATLDATRTRPNEALGHVGAEVLRRVNAGLDDDLLRRQLYGAVGKRYLAHRVLGPDSGRKVRMPEALRSWTEDVCRQQVEGLRAAGYAVVGDLDDLLAHPSAFTGDEQVPTDAELADEAVRALTQLVGDRLTERRDRAARRRRRPPETESRPTAWRRVVRRLRGRG